MVTRCSRRTGGVDACCGRFRFLVVVEVEEEEEEEEEVEVDDVVVVVDDAEEEACNVCTLDADMIVSVAHVV
jgi:hypothetical protein